MVKTSETKENKRIKLSKNTSSRGVLLQAETKENKRIKAFKELQNLKKCSCKDKLVLSRITNQMLCRRCGGEL